MEFLNPKGVLLQLGLEENMVAVDFGCGSGGWVMPLAKILKHGKVYAIDVLQEPLSALRLKLKSENLLNVDVIHANVENHSKILANSCDLVLMTNLLFQAEHREKILEEGKRILKEGGRILVVEWKPGANLGPADKISVANVKDIAKRLDLKYGNEFEAGVYHWALVLTK